MSEKGNCVECGKAFTLERTGKHCKGCFNIDMWNMRKVKRNE